MKLLFDSNVLARICHPTGYRDAQIWFHTIVLQKPPAHEILVSVISLYELHRTFVTKGANESLEQLEGLAPHLRWLPITTETTRRAAELWSEIRTLGQTWKVDKFSDADILIAAQALLAGAVLVSADRDLAALGQRIGLDVRDWNAIDPNTP